MFSEVGEERELGGRRLWLRCFRVTDGVGSAAGRAFGAGCGRCRSWWRWIWVGLEQFWFQTSFVRSGRGSCASGCRLGAGSWVAIRGVWDQTDLLWVESTRSDLGMLLFGWNGGFSWSDGRGGWRMATWRGGWCMVVERGGFHQANPFGVRSIRSDCGLVLLGWGGWFSFSDGGGSGIWLLALRLRRGGAAGGSMAVVGAGQGWLAVCVLSLLLVKIWAWVWAFFMVRVQVKEKSPFRALMFFSLYYFAFLDGNILLLSIRRGGRWPSVRTLSAWSLGRVRVPCFVKWSHPPSCRMKPRAVGFDSERPHSRKAACIMMLVPGTVMMLLTDMMLVSRTVSFSLCHRFLKALRVADDALSAIWCMVEYVTYCNLGLRFYVPPLYSMVSLIKA